ncbi:MAG: aspartate-semialdehyde dehydrogenase [Gammaproteobacteria bacterium]|nr:aspartate-semialdehyde dehydrogenase [Gammaproteobacteria bacterium]
MSKTCDVAVVGATTLVGETLVELLEQREFPLGQLRLLDWGDAVAKRISFKGSHIPVQDIAGFDFSTVGLALFCASEEIAAEFVPRAVEAECVVIDHSARYRNEPDIPLVIPEINPQAIAAYSQRGIIASPAAATTQMLLCVHPLHTAVGIEHISVTVCAAVSEHGRAGVKELAGQTANLLNMRPIESQVFSQQIAFNVLPQVGELEENGYSLQETHLVRESQKVLDQPALKISPTILQAPVFFGHGMVLAIQTQKPIELAQARSLLAKSSALAVVDAVTEGPTAVTEAAGNDAIYVGRLRADMSLESGFTLWAVADNSRKGTALNGVQIAEILVKDYL